MKARDAVGRRIVRIDQARVWNAHVSGWVMVVHEIELDDGTRLRPNAVETEYEPVVEIVVVKP